MYINITINITMGLQCVAWVQYFLSNRDTKVNINGNTQVYGEDNSTRWTVQLTPILFLCNIIINHFSDKLILTGLHIWHVRSQTPPLISAVLLSPPGCHGDHWESLSTNIFVTLSKYEFHYLSKPHHLMQWWNIVTKVCCS